MSITISLELSPALEKAFIAALNDREELADSVIWRGRSVTAIHSVRLNVETQDQRELPF